MRIYNIVIVRFNCTSTCTKLLLLFKLLSNWFILYYIYSAQLYGDLISVL